MQRIHKPSMYPSVSTQFFVCTEASHDAPMNPCDALRAKDENFTRRFDVEKNELLVAYMKCSEIPIWKAKSKHFGQLQ